jgi:hypothetical protein
LRNAGLVNYHADEVQLHNFNARFQILSEGEFDQKWIPAVNKNLTLAAGYAHFGNVLNHEANGVWGSATKWEF